MINYIERTINTAVMDEIEKGLLDEIFNALSGDELEENLKYIADNNDLNDLYKK